MVFDRLTILTSSNTQKGEIVMGDKRSKKEKNKAVKQKIKKLEKKIEKQKAKLPTKKPNNG